MITGFLIFWPLVTALMLFLFRPQNAKVLALISSLVELIVSIVVVVNFDTNTLVQFVIDIPWINSIGVNFAVGIDGISLLLVLLTTVLVPLIILSSFGNNNKSHTFYGLILLMQMALVGVFTARDGFLFYLFWEMALIPIYFICLIWGGENRAQSTLKFFIYTLAGSLFMLIALVYLYLQTPGVHSFSIDALYTAGRALPQAEQSFVFWAFFLAFAIKMPVFPFHTWQPDTYTDAPVQGTMLLSGIMLKMGIFGLIRWLLPVVPAAVNEWAYVAIILSVIGVVYGSCIALVQRDLKRLIAYASIAHIGLIAAGIFTLNKIGMEGAIVQMLSHGIVAFGLFYVVDIIDSRTSTRLINSLGGIRNVAPKFTTVFIIILLGSIALPFTSGFVGEFLLINSLVQYKFAIGALAGLTTILGAVYMLRAFQQSVLGDVTTTTTAFVDLTNNEKIILYPVVLIIILIGVYPAPLFAVSAPAVNNLLMIFSDLSAVVK
jgi:NADH-quinone oxidoreductase subunit M